MCTTMLPFGPHLISINFCTTSDLKAHVGCYVLVSVQPQDLTAHICSYASISVQPRYLRGRAAWYVCNPTDFEAVGGRLCITLVLWAWRLRVGLVGCTSTRPKLHGSPPGEQYSPEVRQLFVQPRGQSLKLFSSPYIRLRLTTLYTVFPIV